VRGLYLSVEHQRNERLDARKRSVWSNDSLYGRSRRGRGELGLARQTCYDTREYPCRGRRCLARMRPIEAPTHLEGCHGLQRR
jgi:hypothetical protein